MAKYTGAGRGADSDGARTAALAVREAQTGNVAALRDSEARSQSSQCGPARARYLVRAILVGACHQPGPETLS